jgi:hypothetical protein
MAKITRADTLSQIVMRRFSVPLPARSEAFNDKH